MTGEDFYIIHGYLCFVQAGLDPETACQYLARIMNRFESGGIEGWKSIGDLCEPYRKCVAVDGFIVEPKLCFLHTETTTYSIDEQFLRECDTSWAAKLRDLCQLN